MIVQLAPDSLVPDLLVGFGFNRLSLDQTLVFEMTEAAVSFGSLLGHLLTKHFLVRRGPHRSNLMSLHPWHSKGLVFKYVVDRLRLNLVVSALHHETVVNWSLTVETAVDGLVHHVTLLQAVKVAAHRGRGLAELAHVIVVVVERDVVGGDVERHRVAEIPFGDCVLLRIHLNDIAGTDSADAAFNILWQAGHPSMVIPTVAQVTSDGHRAIVLVVLHLHGQIHLLFVGAGREVTWALHLLTDELILPARHRFLPALRLQVRH